MSKGAKLSLGEFLGPGRSSNLPTGPAERHPDDDGRFQRDRTRRSEEPSRSDDGNWRRGGGGGGYDSRGDRGGCGDRGGGYGDRGGYDNRDRGGGRDYDNRDRGGGWRSGGGDRYQSRNDAGPPPASERPRLNLKARTVEARPQEPSKQEQETASPDVTEKMEQLQVKDDDAAPDSEEPKKREPKVVNSRAAALGADLEVRTFSVAICFFSKIEQTPSHHTFCF